MPIDDETRADREQQIAILRARKARLLQQYAEAEALLQPRLHEPLVQHMLAETRRQIAEIDPAIAEAERLIET
jgi:hypothetical protein